MGRVWVALIWLTATHTSAIARDQVFIVPTEPAADDRYGYYNELYKTKYKGYEPASSAASSNTVAGSSPAWVDGSFPEELFDSSLVSSNIVPWAPSDQSSNGGTPQAASYSARMVSSGSSIGTSSPHSGLSAYGSGSSSSLAENENVNEQSRNIASVASPVLAVAGAATGGYLAKQGWALHERVTPRHILIKANRPGRTRDSDVDPTAMELVFSNWAGMRKIWNDMENLLGNDFERIDFLVDKDGNKITYHPETGLTTMEASDGDISEELPDDKAPRLLKTGKSFSAVGVLTRTPHMSKEHLFVEIPTTSRWQKKIHDRNCAQEALAQFSSQYFQNPDEPGDFKLSDLNKDQLIDRSQDYLASLDASCEGVPFGKFFQYTLRKLSEEIFVKLMTDESTVCIPWNSVLHKQGLSKETAAVLSTLDIDLGHHIEPDSETMINAELPLIDYETFWNAVRDVEPLMHMALKATPPIFVKVKAPEALKVAQHKARFLHKKIPDHILPGHSFSFEYDPIPDAQDVPVKAGSNLLRRVKQQQKKCHDTASEERQFCVCGVNAPEGPESK